MADLNTKDTATDPVDERQLISACVAGSQRAFADLVGRYKVMVYNLVDRSVGDPGVTDDLAQEVFLRVHRGLPAFRGEAKLSTWIFRIAHRVCLEELQKPHRRQAYVRLDDRRDDPEHSRAPEAAWTVDKEFGEVELRRDVERWLQELPPHYRTALTLHYMQEQRYSEIAEIMNLPEGTVKTYLHRAKQVLRRKMLNEERLLQ